MTRIKRERYPTGEPRMAEEDAMALLTAARGFLLGEWFGAVLLLISFTQLYLAIAGHYYPPPAALGIGGLVAVTGAVVYLQSRRYYLRLDTNWGRRSHNAAAVTAGAGAIFWLLFLVLMVLVWNGFPVTGQ